jgi:hypothetical protein
MNYKYCYSPLLYCVSFVNKTYNCHKDVSLYINEYLATRCIIRTQKTVFRLACYVMVRRMAKNNYTSRRGAVSLVEKCLTSINVCLNAEGLRTH